MSTPDSNDAIPRQKLDAYPWLRTMWAGHAFSIDYRESRGHAYTLHDQDHTERVAQRPQPGACLHCHASIMPAYRTMGGGDVQEGFRAVSRMSWNEARRLAGPDGEPRVSHPVSCVDCHDPQTLALRVTRPAFVTGIREYMAGQGRDDYDVHAPPPRARGGRRAAARVGAGRDAGCRCAARPVRERRSVAARAMTAR